MERMVCPKCKNPCYTAAPSAYLPCPYCGFVFSIKGPTRRAYERIRKEVDCLVLWQDRSIPSRTCDIETNGRIYGLRVAVREALSLKEGEEIRIKAPSLGLEEVKTCVVWQRPQSQGISIGLKVLNG